MSSQLRRYLGLTAFVLILIGVCLPLILSHKRHATETITLPVAAQIGASADSTQAEPVSAPLAPTLPEKKTSSTAEVSSLFASVAAPPEISSPLLEKARVHKQAWIVQVGSFREAARAEALIKKLKAQGFRAFGYAHPKMIHRVCVGPLTDLHEAERLKAKIMDQAHLSGLVTHYDPLVAR